MKLAIAAIGHLKSGPEKDLAADYEQRVAVLGRKAGITGLTIHDWAESRAQEVKLRQADEARHLWSVVPDGSPAIVLDERGQAISSEAFARLLAAEAQKGARQLTLMIWPHRLVRVMLLEQIYRAVTILVNHPYHRA